MKVRGGTLKPVGSRHCRKRLLRPRPEWKIVSAPDRREGRINKLKTESARGPRGDDEGLSQAEMCSFMLDDGARISVQLRDLPEKAFD